MYLYKYINSVCINKIYCIIEFESPVNLTLTLTGRIFFTMRHFVVFIISVLFIYFKKLFKISQYKILCITNYAHFLTYHFSALQIKNMFKINLKIKSKLFLNIYCEGRTCFRSMIKNVGGREAMITVSI